MKVLGIVGGPHKDGTTDMLVSEVLRGATEAGAEAEKINLVDKKIDFCAGCRKCMEDLTTHIGKCAIKDDMADILKAFRAADHYVMGAPIYMMHVNARMKTFIERMYALLRYPEEPGPPMSRRDDGKAKSAVLVVTMGAPKEWAEAIAENAKNAMETILTLEEVTISDAIFGGQGDPVARTIEDQEATLTQAYEAGAKLVKGA
jgi:multimeric flavodoxin WrbA